MSNYEDQDSDDQQYEDILRGVPMPLPDPSSCTPPPAAYAHQLYTLERLEQGETGTPPVSGIVHLPTGAGKTRVALELIARTLHRDPKHRFIWATKNVLLIQQTMKTAHEFAHAFPKGTRIGWYKGEDWLLEDTKIHIVFITQSQLTDVLNSAHAARKKPHVWQTRIQESLPTTFIYDECHQLGGEQLQKEFGKFYTKVLGAHAQRHKWRVIGLSATPVPTREEAHPLLQNHLFPLRSEFRSAAREWNMNVFHRVTNAELIRDGVLCEVNQHLDRSGIFDLGPTLLRKISQEEHVSAPGANAGKDEVVKYSMKFNRKVMGHPTVLQFLAERLARNLPQLGKTIVFVADIAAANLLVAKLNALPGMAGKVAAVHSKMTQQAHGVPGQSVQTPTEVTAKFKARGAEPCILVNVEMLTEGFDDPKVHTIVLAKLTLSTNRFWQMVGRGTRGPRSNGTSDCFVIDPVKLFQLYDYFAGYQPSVNSKPGSAILDEEEDTSAGALDPSVPSIDRAPLPSAVKYRVSDELRKLHEQVATAIDAFLGGARIGEDEAVAISHSTKIASTDGEVVAQPAAGVQTAATGSILIRETLQRIAATLGADLSWLERQVPNDTSDDVVRFWVRKCNAIEQLQLRSEAEYTRAEMDGRLATLLATPVVRAEAKPQPTPGQVIELTQTTLDAATLCRAVAYSDGELVSAEIEVTARVLGRIAAAIDSPDLRKRITMGPPVFADIKASSDRFRQAMGPAGVKQLLKGLVEVALADARIHANEIAIISEVAQNMGMSKDYAEGLLDFAS